MMNDYIENSTQTTQVSEQEKVISLFKFIRELNALKQKTILNMGAYPWSQTISSLPDDPENISVYYRDRVDAEEVLSEWDATLLSVHKPEFESCPVPDSSISDWLEDGWNSFFNDVIRIERKGLEHTEQQDSANSSDSEEQFEYFSDDNVRVSAYNRWIELRNAWAERQKTIDKTRELFTDLYRLYFDLQRDSETMELVVANGILCDRRNPSIKHPVITKRVKLRYDAAEDTIYIDDAETSSELYSLVFQALEDVNVKEINLLQQELQENDYHPLDRNETPKFLRVLLRRLSSDGTFSENGEPGNWAENSRLLLYSDPCFIMRKRLDGTLKAIEQIISNIEETGYIPAPIRDIVSGGKINLPEANNSESIEEQLAAVGGESIDVLLSKEANREQLEIAKRIELYNAVLVQGPPGTGKTHTIANLLGHFLAQGKSVLVTSQTIKALSVLKDKVPTNLQSLCVSVLDDSNVDMEKSVDGITDYMSRYTAHELKQKMDVLAEERQKVANDLAKTRRSIYNIISQECSSVNYNGEELSPSKIAEYVLQHSEDLSYIPGKVRSDCPLPLSYDEIVALYKSNVALSNEDETELNADIPAPTELLDAESFSHICDEYHTAKNQLKSINDGSSWHIKIHSDISQISFDCDRRSFSIDYPDGESVKALESCSKEFADLDSWAKYAAVDGKSGGAYRKRWETLIEQLKMTYSFAEGILEEQFGVIISFENECRHESLIAPLKKLKEIFEQKGKLSKLTLMLNKDCATALECVSVNGHPVSSAKECQIVLDEIELLQHRKQCAVYWNELLSKHDVPTFDELDSTSPERIAVNMIPSIEKYLNWYRDDYAILTQRLLAIGISPDSLFNLNPLDSDFDAVEKILKSIASDLPIICNACFAVLKIIQCEQRIASNHQALQSGNRSSSRICHNLAIANDTMNVADYSNVIAELTETYNKHELQTKRKELLLKLEPVAPQWASAIRNREGIHSQATPPDSIEDAWKWKQLSAIVGEIVKQPFDKLQDDSLRLSKEYRKITAEYAEKSAWYHLISRTEGDIDIRHSLQGWKQTVKKIGKGTGKNAPALKAKARELMSRCQSAVPAWIMPINRALDTLDPKKNQFDVVIIDEASQSDVSSLAILYMGKKLIIVGDDKQVSPMAIGVEVDKINALQQMYIQNKIPNYHLYDAKTSIYDIAKTTFQPLMLREHFRCVPEIIGFSNMLSYNDEIKPLRDASSSSLLPAVVNYRVDNGQRQRNKTNPNEAEAIVALLQSCLEQPEYKGKTFGVISLLGDEQVKVIQRLIEEKIDHNDLIERNILCGNASNFQGDERDVIFLSVVDSSEDGKPIKLQGFGTDDAFRKRYNVAASRARDQLWVVYSLNPSTDLKPGDIRKTLIDYSINPSVSEQSIYTSEYNEESPLQIKLAKELQDRGFKLERHRSVGAYCLDLVAVCENNAVAIECDGERVHSGISDIRNDMERQTILERLGWKFIRIRGSEYFLNPNETMNRVVKELSDFGIKPSTDVCEAKNVTSSNLLERVTSRTTQILAESKSSAEEETSVDVQISLPNGNGMVSGDQIKTNDRHVVEATPVRNSTPVIPKPAAVEKPQIGNVDKPKMPLSESKSQRNTLEEVLKSVLKKSSHGMGITALSRQVNCTDIWLVKQTLDKADWAMFQFGRYYYVAPKKEIEKKNVVTNDTSLKDSTPHMSNRNNRNEFYHFLVDEVELADSTALGYSYSIEECEHFAQEHDYKSWKLYTPNLDEAKKTVGLLRRDTVLTELDTSRHNQLSSTLKRFSEFLEFIR